LREARNAAQAETRAVEEQFTGRLDAAAKRLAMLARDMAD
jgi:hypothetical protein